MEEHENRKRKININHWYKICECLWEKVCVCLCVSECNEIPQIPHVSQFAKGELPLSLSLSLVFCGCSCYCYCLRLLIWSPCFRLPFMLAHFAQFYPRCEFLVFSFISLALVRILCRKRICVRWLPAVRFCRGDHSVFIFYSYLCISIQMSTQTIVCWWRWRKE